MIHSRAACIGEFRYFIHGPHASVSSDNSFMGRMHRWVQIIHSWAACVGEFRQFTRGPHASVSSDNTFTGRMHR